MLYGILKNNLAYKVRQLSAGRYANGNQEIRCTLNELYLNEMDVLLILPQRIETTTIQYGDTQTPMASTTYYAVGKITSYEIDNHPQQLTTNTDTLDGQQVRYMSSDTGTWSRY